MNCSPPTITPGGVRSAQGQAASVGPSTGSGSWEDLILVTPAEAAERAVRGTQIVLMTLAARQFDAASVAPGVGTTNMRDRLVVGGTLTVHSAPGGGTRVVGRVPRARSSRRDRRAEIVALTKPAWPAPRAVVNNTDGQGERQ
jgi:hypothetical protein